MANQSVADADALDRDVRLFVFGQAADTARIRIPTEIAA